MIMIFQLCWSLGQTKSHIPLRGVVTGGVLSIERRVTIPFQLSQPMHDTELSRYCFTLRILQESTLGFALSR